MRAAIFFAALVALASVASAAHVSDNPVNKVVDLITELKSKIEADGKTEQKLYDKYACWCEKTTSKYAAKIEEEKARIEELSQHIVKLKAKLGALAAEIVQLKKEVAEAEASMKEATEIRHKENSDYGTERTEMEQAIGAMERAIKVLHKGTAGGAAGEAQLLTVAADVKMALKYAHKVQMPADQLNSVRSFLSQNSGNFNTPYAPASTQIQGILKDMYDTFTSNLETANTDEAIKEKDFQDFMAAKKTELDTLKSTLAKKTAENADATKDEADSQVERKDTQQELKDDEKFFDDTKNGCKAKADAWAERSRLRTEELNGINKALEILTGPEAQAIFNRATSSFVQMAAVSQRRTSSSVVAEEAAFELAHSTSARVRALALAMRSDAAAQGHFDVIISEIDKMVVLLRDEEQEDIKHRDWCEKARAEGKNTKEDLQYQQGELETKGERLTSKKEEIDTNIAATETSITDLKEVMADALDTRNKEHDEFVSTLKDDQAAVALLAKTIESLGAFYKKNKIEMIQEDPKYTVDEDKAPDSFKGDYGGKKSESRGIVAILAMIKEDLENEVKHGKADENSAQETYFAARADNDKSLSDLDRQKADQSKFLAETKKKIAANNEAISAVKGQVGATDGGLDKLRPNCDWVQETFGKRRDARKAELQGLQNAKDILAGATGSDFGASLLQDDEPGADADVDAAADDENEVDVGTQEDIEDADAENDVDADADSEDEDEDEDESATVDDEEGDADADAEVDSSADEIDETADAPGENDADQDMYLAAAPTAFLSKKQ